jgi:hypothetical protein
MNDIPQCCYVCSLQGSTRKRDCLIIYGFTSRSGIFHLYGYVTIAGDGLQNLAYDQCSGPLSREDLYCATPAVTWDLGFSGLIQRTAPFSGLLRHTRGCGGSILTRILTGSRKRERMGDFDHEL